GLDDLLPRHFLAGVRVDALEADRLAVARVEHAERQVVAARARRQRDGHVEQSEAEVAGPDRSGHAVARRCRRTASLPRPVWWPCASAIAAPMPDPGAPARAAGAGAAAPRARSALPQPQPSAAPSALARQRGRRSSCPTEARWAWSTPRPLTRGAATCTGPVTQKPPRTRAGRSWNAPASTIGPGSPHSPSR